MYLYDVNNPKSYNNKMGHYKTRRVLEFINQYANRSMRILDIGGGSGRFAVPLYESGHNVILVEKSREAVDSLSSRCSGVKCIVGEFDKVEFDKEDKFDLILMIEFLLSIKDWPSTFRKVHSLLSDGGAVIFTATNKYSWRLLAKKAFLREKEDFTIFSISEHEEILEQSGFGIRDLEGYLWIPCRLASNSVLVDIFAWIEKALGLKRFVGQSPWLLYAVQKQPVRAQGDKE